MENEQFNEHFYRIREEYIDQFDEELEMEFGEADDMGETHTPEFRRRYFKELYRLKLNSPRYKTGSSNQATNSSCSSKVALPQAKVA